MSKPRRTRRGPDRASDADLIERFFGDAREAGSERARDRKLKQLAREVYRVLAQALAELGDPRLESAFLVEVRPAPDAGRFAVQVSAGGGDAIATVEAALDGVRVHLRGELAAALMRKRVPDLVFEVVP